ncbi:TPA: EpsG family protein [Vibrio cholerae]
MIYLFLISFSSIYFWIVYSKHKFDSASFFVAFSPILLLMALIPGLQYGVGKDYFAYVSIIDDMDRAKLMYGSEFFFYLILLLLHEFSLDPQVLFLCSSLLISICFMLLTQGIWKVFDYKSGVFFLVLLITTSTIFHGQMNILRQSVAMALILLGSFSIIENRKVAVCVCFFMAFGFHNSSILIFPLLFFLFIKSSFGLNLCVIFISFFFYAYIIPEFGQLITKLVFSDYSFYFGLYSTRGEVVNVLSKLYYVPPFVIAMYLSFKSSFKYDLIMRKYNTFLSFFILSPVLMLSNEIFARVSIYFNPFVVFPLSYLMFKLNSRYKILFFFYCIAPYLAKVVFFPIGEYGYHSYVNM